MIYGKVGILLIIVFVSLITIPTALCSSATLPIVYVAGDGSGDYNCDGTDDHIQLNQALSYINSQGGGTVYLKGPNTYWISDTVLIGDRTTLTGDSDAVIKLIGNVGWPKYKAMIANMDAGGNHYVTIHGFEIDGNSQNQPEDTGNRYHRQIAFWYSTNVEIYDMYMHHGLADFITMEYDSGGDIMDGNFLFHDNIFYKCGHDAINFIYTGGGKVYNNVFTIRTNSATRLTNSNNIEIYDNIIRSDWSDQGSSTGPAIQMQSGDDFVMDNVEIHHNTIYDIVGSGIWIDSGDDDSNGLTNGIYIHHNTFTRVGQYWNINGYSNSGIVIGQAQNTIIENNVFDNAGRSAIAHISYEPIVGSGWTTIVRNNIIMNSQFGTGIAIYNEDYTSHNFITENNDIYNVNKIYSGRNVMSVDDIYVDPLVADPSNRDYHLKSAAGRWSDDGWVFDAVTSPLIDAGYSTFDYSNEPESNGNRINIGRYGNTAEASRSVSDQTTAYAGPDRTVTVGEVVTLDGSASTDDVGIVSHIWDFDDSDGLQQDATSAVVQHSYGVAGTYATTLTVTGAEGGTDSDSVTITVNAVNKAPVMNSIGAKSVEGESALSFTISASDADDDILTYSAMDLPSGASFDSSTGTFSWTPSDSQSGTHSVIFEVTDGQLSDSEEVTITVNGNYVPTPNLVYDNRLRESSPDSVHSDNDYADIGHKTDVGRYRDVMWFDLSMYNTTDTIADATLSLYWYYPANSPRNQDTVVEIYRIADWNPDSVSWNNKAAGTPWNNPGGDWFDKNNVAQGSKPYASITFDANDLPDNRYYEFDITELVRDYVSGEYDNTGFFLKAQNEYDNYIAFYSSDWSNEGQRPKLTITHTSDTEPVDNNAPKISTLVPSAGSTYNEAESISIEASASDEDGDTLSYIIKIDGVTVSTSSSYVWNTDSSSAGIHIIEVNVSDGTESTSIQHSITINDVHPRWDVNEDGEVNILDITIIGQHYGNTVSAPYPRWDVNEDGMINIQDLTITSYHFSETVE